MYLGVELPSELVRGAGVTCPYWGLRGNVPERYMIFIFRRGWFNFLVFILTLVLNGNKLGRNFISVVILNFMPLYRSILVSWYDSSSTLMEELELRVHN